MERACEPFGRFRDARTCRHEIGAGQDEDAVVARGGQCRQCLPGAEVDRSRRTRRAVRSPPRARAPAASRCWPAPTRVSPRQDVVRACHVEHVVQEADPAARVEVAECAWLTAEHQQRPRPRATGHPRCASAPGRARSPPPLPSREPSRRCGRRGQQRGRHLGKAAVCIREDGNRRARELLFEFGLRAVGDHQVGPQAEDALEIGIEQRPTRGSRSTSGGSWS